jgi:large subunit ribosomal protein L25
MEIMEEYVLEATKRDVLGKKVKALRREGLLPAVIYGKGFDSLPITLNTRDVRQTLKVIGANTLVTIKIGKEEHLALVRDIQREVIMQDLLHLDFQAVSLEETITSTVPIAVIGDAPAVSEFNAVLVTSLDELEIEAKAKDLPDMIEVDVSDLTEIGDHILVKDLKIPGDVTVLEDPEEIVVVASAQTLMELEPEVEEGAELLEELTDAELLEEEGEELAEVEPEAEAEAEDE